MIENLLKLFVVSIIILICQMSYNAQIYRHIGYIRWFKFITTSIITMVLGYLLIIQTDKISKIPYVGKMVSVIDSIFSAFYQYLPKKLLFFWLLAPFLIACIFFTILTVFKSIEIRKNFMSWKKRNQEILDDGQQIDNTTERMIKTEEDTFSSDQLHEVTQEIHFLNEETTRIRYDSILGLRKVFEKSKQKGLQLGETEEGYVAVYSNKDGYISLKYLLEKNNLPINSLEPQPSIVIFDKENIKHRTVKEALEILNRGESLG
ncbi:hypothetical protein [Enterococcus mundtii]|uniref:hypothetical protein n=1 Tax=Enterococcus mundtii TaxID=53346 RepID=UPI000DFDDEDF|nr:hypothetical protein [Enterococcus mundtii]STE38130.1 Uncharacterised protein [Enterococcus mundtii]